MGLTSENVAAAYGIPRDRQDIMAADSHKKAEGRFGRRCMYQAMKWL